MQEKKRARLYKWKNKDLHNENGCIDGSAKKYGNKEASHRR